MVDGGPDMRRAAPGVPIQPWLSPKLNPCGKDPAVPGGSWLSAGNRSTMWEEQAMHLALSTGAREFLWWKLGRARPLDLGLQLLSTVLGELDQVTGLGSHRGCRVEPIISSDNRTAIDDYAQSSHLRVMSIPTEIPDLTENYLRFEIPVC
jgi:hypothetical protein